MSVFLQANTFGSENTYFQAIDGSLGLGFTKSRSDDKDIQPFHDSIILFYAQSPQKSSQIEYMRLGKIYDYNQLVRIIQLIPLILLQLLEMGHGAFAEILGTTNLSQLHYISISEYSGNFWQAEAVLVSRTHEFEIEDWVSGLGYFEHSGKQAVTWENRKDKKGQRQSWPVDVFKS
ncbi:hypothetical protein FBU30_000472 [Linnemannia zychae]|nr:hypothetical protein FBU30_000472 [Linnemannia zychae]